MTTAIIPVLLNVPPLLVRLLQVAGGPFLLYLALGAARATYRYGEAVAAAPATHVTFWKAVLLDGEDAVQVRCRLAKGRPRFRRGDAESAIEPGFLGSNGWLVRHY